MQKHQNEKAQTANIFTAPKWVNEGQKPQGAQHIYREREKRGIEKQGWIQSYPSRVWVGKSSVGEGH